MISNNADAVDDDLRLRSLTVGHRETTTIRGMCVGKRGEASMPQFLATPGKWTVCSPSLEVTPYSPVVPTEHGIINQYLGRVIPPEYFNPFFIAATRTFWEATTVSFHTRTVFKKVYLAKHNCSPIHTRHCSLARQPLLNRCS